MTNTPKILIIYTGGTIGMVRDYETRALKAFDFDYIYENIPELNHLNCDVETVSFKDPIDSSNMNTGHWVQIIEILEQYYYKKDGFVILTGSDTMSYTASAISFMIENLAKPVIFTGSQLPIGDLRTDAKENLITAIQIASERDTFNKPVVTEVGLYFEYKLYRGNRTTKINSEQFEAFTSPNYPPLGESGVHLKFNYELLLRPDTDKKPVFRKLLDNHIALLKIFPGINPQFVQSVIDTEGLKALILESYGSGNAPTESWFLNALKQAKERGVHLVDITQCTGGGVLMGQYDTSVHLKEMGVIDGRDITTESALAKMMYLLAVNIADTEFKVVYETQLRGEMS